jgi:hypothetical protein
MQGVYLPLYSSTHAKGRGGDSGCPLQCGRTYVKPYEANKSGPRGNRLMKVMSEVKVLAAIVERYQREVPGAREEIDRVLEVHEERQGQGEA